LDRLIFCCINKKKGKIEFWQSSPIVFVRKSKQFDEIFITKKISKAFLFWKLEFPEMKMGLGSFWLKRSIQEEKNKYKKTLEVKFKKKKKCSHLKRIK